MLPVGFTTTPGLHGLLALETNRVTGIGRVVVAADATNAVLAPKRSAAAEEKPKIFT